MRTTTATKPERKVALPKAIQNATAMYYARRSLAHINPWNKTVELENIDSIAVRLGMSFTAIAGTFWFRRGHRCIRVNERTFPMGVREKKQTAPPTHRPETER